MNLCTTNSFFVVCVLLCTYVQSAEQAHIRHITVKNNCKQTLWPGTFTGNVANGKPGGVAAQGGWRLNVGASSTFTVSSNWTAGYVWARTACNFTRSDVRSCATGACNGGLHCTQPGIPPITMAEFTLNGAGQDKYDVSIVDGSNLPMTITADKCPTASCVRGLNRDCPAQLQYADTTTGKVVGCKSACQALGGESNCCTGAHNTPQTCPSSGVAFYDYFKEKCPDSFAYAFDDRSGTALKSCRGAPSYTLTFCP